MKEKKLTPIRQSNLRSPIVDTTLLCPTLRKEYVAGHLDTACMQLLCRFSSVDQQLLVPFVLTCSTTHLWNWLIDKLRIYKCVSLPKAPRINNLSMPLLRYIRQYGLFVVYIEWLNGLPANKRKHIEDMCPYLDSKLEGCLRLFHSLQEDSLMWLVKYEGGGYDGCLWEPNFLLCDNPENPQEFVNIFASGFRGIRSLAALQKLVAEKPGEWYLGLYDLQNKGWEALRSEVTADQACMIGRWLIRDAYVNQGIAEPDRLTIQCYECGEEIDVTDILLEDWHGIGGVHSACKHGICQTCKDTRDHKEVVYAIRGLLENWWDEWEQYDDWDMLNMTDDMVSDDQLCIIEYAIRRWGDKPDARGIADWITENWDEAKKAMCQDQQEELSL